MRSKSYAATSKEPLHTDPNTPIPSWEQVRRLLTWRNRRVAQLAGHLDVAATTLEQMGAEDRWQQHEEAIRAWLLPRAAVSLDELRRRMTEKGITSSDVAAWLRRQSDATRNISAVTVSSWFGNQQLYLQHCSTIAEAVNNIPAKPKAVEKAPRNAHLVLTKRMADRGITALALKNALQEARIATVYGWMEKGGHSLEKRWGEIITTVDTMSTEGITPERFKDTAALRQMMRRKNQTGIDLAGHLGTAPINVNNWLNDMNIAWREREEEIWQYLRRLPNTDGSPNTDYNPSEDNG